MVEAAALVAIDVTAIRPPSEEEASLTEAITSTAVALCMCSELPRWHVCARGVLISDEL